MNLRRITCVPDEDATRERHIDAYLAGIICAETSIQAREYLRLMTRLIAARAAAQERRMEIDRGLLGGPQDDYERVEQWDRQHRVL